MSVNISKIKKKVMVFIIGLTEKSSKAIGKMEHNMEKAYSLIKMVKVEKVYGKMGNV